VLGEHWPFSCLQLYCDATVDEDPDLVVDVMMAVGGRMSGEPLGEDTRPFVKAMTDAARTFEQLVVRDVIPGAKSTGEHRGNPRRNTA
jgi:hypothetical protein